MRSPPAISARRSRASLPLSRRNARKLTIGNEDRKRSSRERAVESVCYRRGCPMRVTDVKTFLVHPGVGKNWLFVKVETDEGIHGWGEAYTQADRDQAIEAHIHEMERYLVGRDPFAIKHFTYGHVPRLRWASAARWTSTAPSAASSTRCGTSSARRRASRSTTCSAAVPRQDPRLRQRLGRGRADAGAAARGGAARSSRGASRRSSSTRSRTRGATHHRPRPGAAGGRAACAPCARRSGRTSTS